MSHYYLEMIAGSEPGKRYKVATGAVSIGRSQQNSIVLPSAEKSVSSHHAILYCYPDRITLQDLQSTNGTFVNDTQISEGELHSGDTIGLGKAGPRLKLIESDIELAVSTSAPAQPQHSPFVATSSTQPAMPAKESFARTDENPAVRPKSSSSAAFAPPGGGQTMELEHKLVHHQADGSDLGKILDKNGRLDRILERGNVSHDQASMLKTMQQTHRSVKKQWLIITLSIAAAAVLISGFFAARALSYRAALARALSLEKKLEEIETEIAVKRRNPAQNEGELKQLIAEMESAQKELVTTAEGMGERGYQRTFDDPLESDIDKILQRFGETQYSIPPEMVQRVKHHIEVYTGPLSGTMGRYIKRREQYFPMIINIFKEKRLPLELAYISMLESGFNPLALSHAGARGLWQFMPATGRAYKLRVDETVDERTDPQKATYAAAEYFKDLIGIFGGRSSMMLAMAAYNAGEGRVIGALRKIDDPMRNRDFWYIYRMGYLAEETNEYIPRVIAMMIISENPQRFGLTAPIGSAGISAAQTDLERDFIELEFRKD